MARGNRVTWRLEIAGAWGGRLDPTWLPSGDTESWRKIFETEDLAGRVFAAGGAGLRWAQLAETTARIGSVLEQYRMQWRCADEVAGRCPESAASHVAALVVPPTLKPPRRSRPDGTWRVCALVEGSAVTVDRWSSVDLAEGAAVAHRTLATDRAWWAEPTAAGPAPPSSPDARGWLPRANTDLRLAAFAAEESVATLCAATTTGHTGPDMINSRVLCKLGMAAHRMILEYRTLFRGAWDDLEACSLGDAHDAQAQAMLDAAPDPDDHGPDGRWRHVVLTGGAPEVVSEHDGHAGSTASVAAARSIDERSVRWCEPVAAGSR